MFATGKEQNYAVEGNDCCLYGVTESEGNCASQKQPDILKVQEVIPYTLNDGEE